ncbi:MAG TPA: hypothetical protein VM938_06840 [Acidimicrobiales bacterium]|nr:hypothetical protein [Acidimicrobiales bacterium]
MVAVAAASLVSTGGHVSAQGALVEGTVVPSPTGDALVSVYVWPSAEAAVSSVGSKLELPLVAQAAVNDGRFTVPLPADLAAVTDQAAHNGGYANFMVTVVSEDRSGTSFFTRSLAAPSVAVLRVPLDAPAPSAPQAATQTTICLPETWSATRAGPICTGGSPPSGSPCYAEVIETGAYADTIGEIHVPAGGSGTYVYSTGSQSDLGVGISSDNRTWKTEGSIRVTKSSTAATGWNVPAGFANQLQTFFRFDKYKVQGYCPPQWTIQGNTWHGGSQTGVGVGQWDGQCLTTYKTWAVPYGEGSFLIKNTGRGFHYKIGATAFGVNLSSSSDWMAQHNFRIDFSRAATMCGNDGPIPESSLVYKQ